MNDNKEIFETKQGRKRRQRRFLRNQGMPGQVRRLETDRELNGRCS